MDKQTEKYGPRTIADEALASLIADREQEAKESVGVYVATGGAYEELSAAVRECPARIGRYQRDVLLGRRTHSGADLAGRARQWGDRYSASRSAAYRKLAESPEVVAVRLVRGRHGRWTMCVVFAHQVSRRVNEIRSSAVFVAAEGGAK